MKIFIMIVVYGFYGLTILSLPFTVGETIKMTPGRVLFMIVGNLVEFLFAFLLWRDSSYQHNFAPIIVLGVVDYGYMVWSSRLMNKTITISAPRLLFSLTNSIAMIVLFSFLAFG